MAYTTIDDPSEYFQTQLYTGDGNTTQAITNSGNSNLKPDWVWLKQRANDSANRNHMLFDSTRGSTKALSSNTNGAEDTSSGGYIQSFNTDGFTTGNSSVINKNAVTYVGWQWKANGGTTTTNDASSTGVGTIDSVYQANTTAGFSIVTYTGTGSAGTIAHGLGKKPQYILLKNRSFNDSWMTFNEPEGATKFLSLDVTDASNDYGAMWNDTEPTTSVFSIGSSSGGRWVNSSGDNYVAYCFTEIKGYSKMGSYTGNGNADGTFIYTGFKPAWLLVKDSSASENWMMYDNKRDPFNEVDANLKANESNAESDFDVMDFVSNGFKIRQTSGDTNNNGNKYIYLAFAEHPLVSSKGAPTTAR